MKELIFFGRGGQGGVTGAQILAEAAVLSGKYHDCSSFPSFGAERRGAPVEAYCRISNEKIWARSQVQNADIAVVLDESILGQHIVDKLKSESILIINTPKCPNDIYRTFKFKTRKLKIITGDLIQICFDLNLVNKENQPIVNTSILGLLTKADLGINLDDLSPIIELNLGKGSKSDLNKKGAKIAAEQAQIEVFS